MKRCCFLFGMIVAVCMMLTSCEIVGEIILAFLGGSETQSVSYNPLRNTTWQSEDLTGGLGSFVGVYMSQRIDFGDTSFKISSGTISNGLDLGGGSKTGTYKISGDSVTLTASDGTVWTGTLIGNSLTLDDVDYTRIQ